MTRTEQTVKVILLSCPPNQPYLEFSLIFEDHCEKHFVLDEYAQKHFRGLQAREVIEEQARFYFDSLGLDVDTIKLIFL